MMRCVLRSSNGLRVWFDHMGDECVECTVVGYWLYGLGLA